MTKKLKLFVCFSTLQIGSLIEAVSLPVLRKMAQSFSTLQIGSLIEATQGCAYRAAGVSFSTLQIGSLIEALDIRTPGKLGTEVSVPFKSGR